MVQSLEESLGEVPDESVVLSSLITLNYQKKEDKVIVFLSDSLKQSFSLRQSF